MLNHVRNGSEQHITTSSDLLFICILAKVVHVSQTSVSSF